MFNDSSDKSFMVRQISRVAQTINRPFPFEHEACLDSTEKQISNAMRGRIQEFKKRRSAGILFDNVSSRGVAGFELFAG